MAVSTLVSGRLHHEARLCGPKSEYCVCFVFVYTKHHGSCKRYLLKVFTRAAVGESWVCRNSRNAVGDTTSALQVRVTRKTFNTYLILIGKHLTHDFFVSHRQQSTPSAVSKVGSRGQSKLISHNTISLRTVALLY